MNDRSTGPSWLLPRLKRIGVAHTQGDRVCLVIAELAPAGSGGEGAPPVNILLTETYPLTALPDLRAALAKHHARHLIRIAPAARTIARSIQIPKAPTPELVTALELMAEAQLATTPEPHRRGWGVLPLPAARDSAGAVVLGWLGSAPDPILDGPTAPAHESWTSELVALALLLPGEGASAACIDRSSGSIGIATCSPTLRLRSLREDAGNAERFGESVRSVREAMNGGGTDATVATDGSATILLSRDVAQSLRAISNEASQPTWLARYALCAGVARAALDENLFLSVRAALSLRAEPPPRQMSPLERAMRWISVPRHAYAVAAAGLAVALFAPLGLAAARSSLLTSRLDATKEGGADTQLLQKQGDFMDELSRRRWPMTKLLGDLAGSMPVGVQVESITLSPGDRVSIRGIADTSDKLSEFTKRLNDTGVFQANIDSRERVAEGFSFDITSARVVRPTAEAKGLEDFAAQSLGVRLYGEDYKEVEAAEQAKQKEADAKRADSAGGGGNRRGELFNTPSSREADQEPIPEPLSTEKIAKLDRTDAGKEMSLRRKVASRAGLDPEVKKRLNSEVEALRARLAELKGAGQ